MLDDLRNSSSFIDEEDNPSNLEAQNNITLRRNYRQQQETFLGMTAQQRFFLSLMLFVMIFVLGVFALVVSGSIILPF